MRDKREFRKEDEAISIEIGEIMCPSCGSSATHIERKGKGFITHFAQCSRCNTNTQLDKNIYDVFQIGDRIRYYRSSFGKNSEIDFTSYVEGIIIHKEKFVMSYLLDITIEKAVHKNKKYNKDTSIYNEIYKGIDSNSNCIELLTPQMRMAI